MSAIETILTRAMSEPAFADMLFADADNALTGYDLTADERASLKSMSRIDFEKFAAATPEERKSFGAGFHITKLVDKASPNFYQ